MTDPKVAPRGTVGTRFDPIHSAARMRDVDAVRQELAAGVAVDVVNGRAENGDGKNTALWFAAQGPRTNGVDIARMLIEAGADVDKQCEHGRTALHMAAAWGHADVVQLLLEKGAQMNVVPGGFDYAGTGLHYAAFNSHRPMVEFLLDNGADRNVKDTKVNATAAGWADYAGHTELRDLLQ